MGLGKGPTKLEQKVEKFLTTLSSSVTPQYRLNGFFVDFALPKQKLAVLADGCFWHCCPIHFPMAASRSQQHTLAVDKKRDKALKRAGWRILHIWECEIDKPATLEKLKKEVMSNAYPGCGN
jgi:DNA mismatch endonuclease Vsr